MAMTPSEFLRAVWPETGLYCIATPFPAKGFDHHVFETIDEAVAYAESIADTKDVYFAVHTLKEPKVWNEKHHKDRQTNEWVPGWSVRLQRNMRSARALFFDLDVGADDSGKYPDQIAAITALRKFTTDTKLPKPLVVSSGGGVHAYWLLDRELASAEEWSAQAARLKQLAIRCGLKVDPSRTTDTASVLRVVGTFNLKKGLKRPVLALTEAKATSAEEWGHRLLAALTVLGEAPKAAVKALPDGLVSNLVPVFDGPVPPLSALLSVCPQMRRLEFLHGNYPEPQWYHGLIGNVKFVQDGEALIHEMSSGYPGYSRAGTDEKIARWGASGATSCERMAAVCGERNCLACPHFKRGQFPTTHARNIDKAPPPIIEELIDDVIVTREVLEIPAPYKWGPKGGVEMLMEDNKGKQFSVEIYPYKLYPLDRSSDKVAEVEQAVWRVYLPHDQMREFTVDATTFVDDKALKARLANLGVYPKEFPAVKQFMSAYMRGLIAKNPASVQYGHLGWIDDHKGFVLPDAVYATDGSITPSTLSSSSQRLRAMTAKAGTLQKQVDLLHFYDNPAYAAHQLFILASLGSVLFYATGNNGMIVSANGLSGCSKSTALFTGAGFWGPPKQFSMNGNKDGATTLARDARMSLLSNLPLCIDEITRIAPDLAKDFALNIDKSGPRDRLNRHGDMKAQIGSTERATMALVTTNTSLHSLLSMDNAAGTAASARVFEMRFTRTGVHKTYEADAYLRGIMENYGWIGEGFIKAILPVMPRVEARVHHVMKEIGIQSATTEDERFWISDLASSLVAGEISKSLGYISWDLIFLRNWAVQTQLQENRGIVSAETAHNEPTVVLANYLEAINGNLFITEGSQGGNLYSTQTPRGQLLGQLDQKTRCLYVLKDGFRHWCERNGVNALDVLRQLHASRVVPILDGKRTLAAGTAWAKARSSCFMVDMNHPDISDVQLKVVEGSPPAQLTEAAGRLKLV